MLDVKVNQEASETSLLRLGLCLACCKRQKIVFARPLPPSSQTRLATIVDGCNGVLTDLKVLIDRYEALGKYKWTLDRIVRGKDDLGELRARLT